jgi:hypothetical protein
MRLKTHPVVVVMVVIVVVIMVMLVMMVVVMVVAMVVKTGKGTGSKNTPVLCPMGAVQYRTLRYRRPWGRVGPMVVLVIVVVAWRGVALTLFLLKS